MNQQSPQSESSETDAANDIIHKQQFGVLLREAREKQNYTILEVAESLCLSESHIKALEASRIDELPGKTFTLGYIRSYTRLLNIGDQLIIDTYLEHYDEGEQPLQNNSKAARQVEKTKPFILFAAIVLLILIAVMFAWMQSDESSQNPASTDVSIEAVNSDEDTALETPTETIRQNIEIIPATQVAEAVVDDEPEKTQAIEVAENPQPHVVEGDVLQIHAQGDSWAKIEDAGGERLFYATLKAGEDYQFNGRAPFKIFLGNAPAVQLSVNHQDVDLKGHIKSNNVAQISVDESAVIQ